MKAFILAAGYGTRLKPITDFIPKPLTPVFNTTPFDICLERLNNSGITDISANAHHLHSAVSEHIANHHQNINLSIEYEKILGVGGGIGKLKYFFNGDNVLVYNSDIISNLPLDELMDYHNFHKNWATLALVKNSTTDIVLLDNFNTIVSFSDPFKKGWTFSGISVISKKIYSQLPDKEFYNIIDLYKNIIVSAEAHKIKGVYFKNVFWSDIGNLQTYWELWNNLYNNPVFFEYFGCEKNTEIFSVFGKCKSIFIESEIDTDIKNAIVFKNKIIWPINNN